MNVFIPRSKRALGAAIAAILLTSAGQAQDADRQNANRGPTNQETQVARSAAGNRSLEQHLQNSTMRASKLIGMEVQTASGDNLGEVRDIARNSAPGQDMQLILALGGTVGDDQKLIAIPFDDIQIDADGDELTTSRTREQLAGLPAVTLDARGAGGAGPGSAAPAGTASLRERRVGDLIGAEVTGSGDDAVGEVEDIVLSTSGADSVRAVLQVGGVAGIGEKRISLPLSQLDVERSGDNDPTVRVALDTEALERMPEFKYEEDTAAL